MTNLPLPRCLLLVLLWLPFVARAQTASVNPAPQAVVSADGSEKYRTIQEAINAAPQLVSARDTWTIRVKPGTYREQLYIQREKRFIRLVGDDASTTVIVGNLYANLPGPDGQIIGTFRTPTVWIDADDFTLENLTLANDAGKVGQALALRLDGDRIILRRCHLVGWQDTLLSNRGRHYFERCTLRGAVDFIFGGGTAFFASCELIIDGDGYITAPSTLPYDNYGFVFQSCTIRGATPSLRTYLGRPWRAYAASLFLNTEMDGVVRAEGWHNWGRPEREQSSRFIEINSRGTGAQPDQRAPWAKTLSSDEISRISPRHVLGGADGWDPTAATPL